MEAAAAGTEVKIPPKFRLKPRPRTGEDVIIPKP
jgi:hypothetical protein